MGSKTIKVDQSYQFVATEAGPKNVIYYIRFIAIAAKLLSNINIMSQVSHLLCKSVVVIEILQATTRSLTSDSAYHVPLT